MNEQLEKVYSYCIQYGLNVVAALLIFFIGRMVAGFVVRLIEASLVRARVNKTIALFSRHVVYYAVMAFVLIATLNKLGVETSSFIAVIGAASLAVGLALQGSLANFASGVLLILFHPFEVGDFIEAAGTQGTVSEIQIFNTVMTTEDKKIIILPNAKITGDKIIIFPKIN